MQWIEADLYYFILMQHFHTRISGAVIPDTGKSKLFIAFINYI